MWISKPDHDDSFECARHDWAGFPLCEGCFSILKFQLPVPSSNRWTSNWHPCPPPTLWHLAVYVNTREPSQQLRAISASDSELSRPLCFWSSDNILCSLLESRLRLCVSTIWRQRVGWMYFPIASNTSLLMTSPNLLCWPPFLVTRTNSHWGFSNGLTKFM